MPALHDYMLTAQECVALAELVSETPAKGSQAKRQHLALENKLLQLAKFTDAAAQSSSEPVSTDSEELHENTD